MSKPRTCLPKATGFSFVWFALVWLALATASCCQALQDQNSNCLKHYQVIIITLNLKVRKSHYTSLKIKIIYIQIDQWLCIFSCSDSIFYIIRSEVLLFFSIILYSSLTANPGIRSQSVASCGSWILKGQLPSLRYFSKNLDQSLLWMFLKLLVFNLVVSDFSGLQAKQ